MSGKGKCIVMNYNAQRKNCDDEYTKAGNDFFYVGIHYVAHSIRGTASKNVDVKFLKWCEK